jgi:hypothetical protein
MAKKAASPSSPRVVIHQDWKLRKASDYLEFDIHLFAAGLQLYARHRGTEQGNAALDSALLRARLLVDFFMRDNALPDDVIALDFFHDCSPKPYKPRMTNAVWREREKINKRLVHLTTIPMPRLRSNQRYAIEKLGRPIIAAFRDWLAVVPNHRLQKPASGGRAQYETHLTRLERVLQ